LSFFKALSAYVPDASQDQIYMTEAYEIEAAPEKEKKPKYDRDWLLEETLELLIASEDTVHYLQTQQTLTEVEMFELNQKLNQTEDAL